MNTLNIIILTCCLVFSFFLSGMEAGVFALSRFRIRRLIREGNTQARLLQQYLDNPENFLWTILIGNTLVNFTATCLAMIMLHEILGNYHHFFWIVFVPGGLLFYATCDLLPKMLFRLYPNRLCLVFLRPFRIIHRFLSPLVWIVSKSSSAILSWSGKSALSTQLFGTREELRLLMQESARQMTIDEQTMINQVMDLQTLTVGQIMTPISKVVSVSDKTPVNEVLEICRQRRVTRLPVWSEEGARHRIIGLVNVRSLIYEPRLDPSKTASDYLKPALYVDDQRRLEDTLRQLQRSRHHVAIVLDASRREIGVVSLSDILKVMFGELRL